MNTCKYGHKEFEGKECPVCHCDNEGYCSCCGELPTAYSDGDSRIGCYCCNRNADMSVNVCCCGRFTEYDFCSEECMRSFDAEKMNEGWEAHIHCELTVEQIVGRLFTIYAPQNENCEHGGMICHCCYTGTTVEFENGRFYYHSNDTSEFTRACDGYKQSHALEVVGTDGTVVVDAVYYGANDNLSGNGTPLPDELTVLAAMGLTSV